jgi:hypothetical protein
VYVALALAVLAVALLAAAPVLRRDHLLRLGQTPPGEAAWRRVEWGALGVRVFAWTAATGLVLAAVIGFSARAGRPLLAPLAQTSPTVPPAVRVLLGLLAGIALLIISRRLRAPRYRLTASATAGAALGILYAAFYAALAQWQLPALPIVIVGILLVSAVTLGLAARRTAGDEPAEARCDANLMALLGLIGGFAMPALLPSIAQPFLLFSYLLVLDAVMAWIAIRERWLPLMASLLFTAVFEWAWVLQDLTSSRLLSAAVIFAAFAVVGTSPLWLPRGAGCPAGFRRSAAAAAHLPLLLALYLVVVPNYGAQYSILFGFLLVVDAGLLAIAWRGGPAWLHAAGGAATLLTFFLWLRLSYTPASWPWSLLWLALFVALYLVAATPFAALLFFVFIGLALREPHHATALILVMLAFLAVVLAEMLRRRQPLTVAIAIALSAMALMTLAPPLWLALASHALLLFALFAVAWISGRHLLAVLAIPFYVAAVITASFLPAGGGSPAVTLLVIALVPYALFIAYPLALGARAGESIAPYLAAALASLFFFACGWTVRDDLAFAWRWSIGLVPLVAALAMLSLLWRVQTLAPREPRFKLVAAAALAFFTVSIPMLLPAPWAVMLAALEVVALVWLFTRFRHRLLLVWSVLAAAAVFLWLAFDADLFAPWSLYVVYPAGGAAMIFAAYLARRDAPALQRLLSVAGLFELWFLLNLGIANFYHSANGALSFDFMSTPHAADAAYTVAWAVIATGLLVLGYLIGWPAARGAALALLLATTVKCLANDLPRLRGLPLVVSLLGLALSLVVVSVVLQQPPRPRSPNTSPA